jgi:glycyl-tRNA synthetase beta chain
MPELLLEVGTEELPATFVRKAYTDLQSLLTRHLQDAGVLQGDSSAMGTPRRMILAYPDLKERQEDQTKEQRGPSVKAAYDAEGAPTQALLGFCRGQGIDVNELRNDGQYVWVTKQIPGRPTQEILAEIIPQAIRALTFPKTMRWGSSRMRFARPIRWILATFDGEVVPFQVESVTSGANSRGHRFYSPEEFQAHNLAQLVEGLRRRKVEPDPEKRRNTIVSQAREVAAGEPEMSDALIEENVFLTEWPTAITGQFKPEFRDLPEPVLVTAMAKHEKMFPVRAEDGKLLNRFVFIRNSGDDETVRSGAEWVLNARFNDAKFFFDEDKKYSLDQFLEKTSGILFQEKLGTVRLRAERLSNLAACIASHTGGDDTEVENAKLAGLYAKADLSTGLVSELASLQGIIGGEYGRRAALPEDVCEAIARQYDHSKITELRKPADRTAAILVIADQIDKLAGYLGLGMAPSGSSDPIGLRRAATILIEMAWRWPKPLCTYDLMLQYALDEYSQQGVALDHGAAHEALWDIFASRYEALLSEVRYDVLDAALMSRVGSDVSCPGEVRYRLRCLQRIVDNVPFVQTATRPLNIVLAARKKEIDIGDALEDIEPDDLQSEDGVLLLRVLQAQEEEATEAREREDDETVVRLLANLVEPINRFFDSTMVMVEDEQVRYARLTLLEAASQQLLLAGDFTKIVIEGT